MAKNPPVNAEDIETQLRSLDQKDPGGGHGNPLQYSCLENPRDWGAWWAAVCGVAQSQTQLKRLSSSSSSSRLPCPSPSPRACSNSCLLSQSCHPIISSSVAPSPPALIFPVSQLFMPGSRQPGPSAAVVTEQICSFFLPWQGHSSTSPPGSLLTGGSQLAFCQGEPLASSDSASDSDRPLSCA